MIQPAVSTNSTPDELNTQARELVRQQRFDEARELLLTSITKGKTPAACRLLGNIFYIHGDLKKAIELLDEALKLDEHDHASMAMLAETYFALGDVNAAGYSMMAMTEKPEELRYKERFVHFSSQMSFSKYSPLLVNAMIDCLKTPGLDCSNLHVLWYNSFMLNPEFDSIYQTYQSTDPAGKQKLSVLKKLLGGYSKTPQFTFFDAESFGQVKNLDALQTPFFTLGIKNLLIRSLPFEEFLAALRVRLADAPPAPDMLGLVAALAAYAFRTNYIFPVTEEEKKKIDELRLKLEAGLPEGKEWQAALYACYVPLHRLRNAGAVAEACTAIPEMADLVRAQIYEILTIEEIGDTLREVTPVGKEPYNEFPYPRWNTRPKPVAEDAALLKKKGAKILVAGCGTGLEAAQMAVTFPDSDILAVDLSRAAIAYGALRAKEFNLSNIVFAQGDILKLNNRRFDGIIARHMEDPAAALKVLAGLLNPGGLLRVSLQSRIAGANIAKVQEIIKKGGYPATTEGMKAFRKDSRALIPGDIFHDIAGQEDYYQLAVYRDMLFNVQEERFDLLKIKEILADLRLSFLTMNVLPAVMAQFQSLYPNDPEGKELENWDGFERRMPDTFAGMYQFWCRKD